VIDHGRKIAEGTPDDLKDQIGTSTLHVRLDDSAHTATAAAVVRSVVTTEVTLSPEAGCRRSR
jgi:ABC-2 type transport system ATP-binding protein